MFYFHFHNAMSLKTLFKERYRKESTQLTLTEYHSYKMTYAWICLGIYANLCIHF